MPNPYYTFPPDAPLNFSLYCHNRSDKSPPLRPRLPQCRRRGITHPLPDWVDSPFSDPWAYTSPQAHCTLYTALPPEIRFLIFEVLLGNRVLHVDTSYYRGYRVLKACRHTGARWDRKFWDTVISGYNENRKVTCQCGNGSEDSLYLEILRTCRRIYSECIPLLYTRNIFNFNRDADTSIFTSRPLQKRFQSVSSIEFNLSNTPHRNAYRLPVTRSATYQKLLTSLSYMAPVKIVRLHVTNLPDRAGEHDPGDVEDAINLSWEELWLGPVDKLVRHLASTLEELEFVMPAHCFDLLCRGDKAGAIGGAGGVEETVFCNELRGGKRCRRWLEGVSPGVQYWISCPARDPSPDA
ncbi:uncharacterized protein BDCG_06471 [Blastomyces dermatitidis ER-3]|uniref:DUF7730 domain-containing protein n=2 Tax=Ajellomyces dermatitidis TaxID=5039 RepID=F2TRI6_AJEDA|nr:uncharacterized protein BDCG_06471 [Blastomyces dermatitidis ER-3]EEQ91351.1 hypothetical protein BDCG_06471 [Blastomyces dermatitidis ER-3]EGE85849.2 hypothetical protein BDDG_08794 [Blastomyces dermatitidis ATCC 18188]EQL31696.1 hypothetical protein BDFG_06038 [Blastomyces dermatitidis ATCC 26199]